MDRRHLRLVGILFGLLLFANINFAQTEDRILRADKPSGDDAILQITKITFKNASLNINEPFAGDEFWLRDLRITVKNVSDKKISCVWLSSGLLDGLDQIMKPSESWGDVANWAKGNCQGPKTRRSSLLRESQSDRHFSLRPGNEIELSYADVVNGPSQQFDLAVMKRSHKLVIDYASYRIGKGKLEDTLLLLPENTKYWTNRRLSDAHKVDSSERTRPVAAFTVV